MYGSSLRTLSRVCCPAASRWAIVLLFALGGCAAPDPSTRSTELQENDAHLDPRSPGWWAVLNDPILVGLLERLRKDNLNVNKATARVREARASRPVLGAGRFPTIGVGGTAPRAPDSEEANRATVNELYSGDYDANWEVGVLGGRQNPAQTAEAGQETSVDVHDVSVTLFAEVALNYVEVRLFQTRLSLAYEHIASQSETYVVTRWRRQSEVSRKQDIEQARLDLDETRAKIPILEAGLADARHRLAVLLDESADELAAELAAARAVPSARIGLAVGVPADTLRQRPDVRRAERALAAQLVPETAARRPELPLSGSIGLDALPPAVMSSLIDRKIHLAPFTTDSIRRKIRVRTSLQDHALKNYEAAVIAALKEVDDVLVAYTKGELRRESLEHAVQSAKSAAELANRRYLSDKASLEEMLKAQRSLLSLQDQLATSEGEVASDFIRLYKALGGGWAPLDPNAGKRRHKNPGRPSSAELIE